MSRPIIEGNATIRISEESKISKKLPVFYNPIMKFNRDISVLLLDAIPGKEISIADPLAASGIRSIRFLLELKKGKIHNILLNDIDPDFRRTLKENFQLNRLDLAKLEKKGIVEVMNTDANLALLHSHCFDYIDIDPFGTPNPFLDSAVKRIAHEGILAVTATDTSVLCGTYENACKRKYWAVPLHNELMHEIGLRILIRKVQLVGCQFEKALIPIFSYSKDHYVRAFLQCRRGKKEADTVLKQHLTFTFDKKKAGPVWTGQLWDPTLVKKMVKRNTDVAVKKFLNIIEDESKIPTVGFYDIHAQCKRNRIKDIPKTHLVMDRIRKAGYAVSRTHFSDLGIRSDMAGKDFIKLLKKT
ncbi:MAG: tRNA (guanine(26)-N(2))-dimethyltransferase [Nanoarchaeota archaeon]